MSLLFRSVLLSGIIAFAPAMALAEDWVVSQVAGPAKYTTDRVTWRDVVPGTVIPDAGWVNTGPRGRLLLVRSKDRVTVQPNTLAGLYEISGGDHKTTIAQEFGRLDLDIEHQANPHLSVATPYLAAVVKGTQFTVKVENGSSDVHVVRGRVEVADSAHGQKADIVTGETAKVTPSSAAPMTINGKVKTERLAQAETDNPLINALQNFPKVKAATFSDSNESTNKQSWKTWSNNAASSSSNSKSDDSGNDSSSSNKSSKNSGSNSSNSSSGGSDSSGSDSSSSNKSWKSSLGSSSNSSSSNSSSNSKSDSSDSSSSSGGNSGNNGNSKSNGNSNSNSKKSDD